MGPEAALGTLRTDQPSRRSPGFGQEGGATVGVGAVLGQEEPRCFASHFLAHVQPHFIDEALREEGPCSGHAIGRKEELGFELKCIHPLCSSPKVAVGLSHVQAGMIMATMKRR